MKIFMRFFLRVDKYLTQIWKKSLSNTVEAAVWAGRRQDGRKTCP